VRFRDHVADLVEGAADEVHELEFGDRTHAGEGGSECRAHDGGLGDGCVDDALGAEAVDETIGDFERAAVDADVFAQAEDGGVAVHFFPDSLADGFEVSELHRVSCLMIVLVANCTKCYYITLRTMSDKGDPKCSTSSPPAKRGRTSQTF